jgi:hypothetical protein
MRYGKLFVAGTVLLLGMVFTACDNGNSAKASPKNKDYTQFWS